MNANQSPVFEDQNAFTGNPVMGRLTEHLSASVRRTLEEHGQWTGSGEALELARLANRNGPELHTHDAKGDRVDRVDFHPAYHALMRRGVAAGLHCSIWEEGGTEKGHRNFIRAARFFMTSGTDAGHTCPLTMTNASVAALMTTPGLLNDWMPGIMSRQYDSTFRPRSEKAGLTIGMGMTERQGGSDVRANITSARKLEQETGGDVFVINGHKWFFSAPMCDAFLVLAQSETGLSCFLLPRLLPDGMENGIRLQRLKDKLGNRSNASTEVEFENAFGFLVGEEGEGIRTILEMVTLTRLDCAVGSAGLMRAALAEAVHHTRYRAAFGKQLIDQPLMQRVLADLALDSAATTALTLRLAASYDAAAADPAEAGFARLMTPVIKYWVCKSAPAFIYEAMECLGGNGYVEEGNLARLYREAPLNAIWEGSGNIMCLDVLRVMRKGPRLFDAVLDGIAAELGSGAKQTVDVLRLAANVAEEDEGSARMLTEQLALTAAAAELRRSFGDELAGAFMESRLGRPWRATYGMLDGRFDARRIVDFVCPEGTL